MTERGQVKTDAHWATSVKGIYAIGDCIDGPDARPQGRGRGHGRGRAPSRARHGHVNYDVIPSVIYTHPEVAAVGKTEEALKEEGRAYKAGKFSFMGNGRAKANFAGDGFVKILADKETDRDPGRAHHRPDGRRSDPRDLRRRWSSAPPPRTSPAPAMRIRPSRRRCARRRWRLRRRRAIPRRRAAGRRGCLRRGYLDAIGSTGDRR